MKILLPMLFSTLFLLSCDSSGHKNLQILMPQTIRKTVETPINEFEREKNLMVSQVYVAGTGSMVSKLTLEKIRPQTDIAAFLNAQQSEKIIQMYQPIRVEQIDTGYLAIVTREGVQVHSLKDLLQIVDEFGWIDPRTSSPGSDFLLWTYAVFSEDEWNTFWKTVAKKSKFFASSWSDAYNWYSQGLVKGMVSYHTDQAYNVYYKTNLVSVIHRVSEGWVKQSEYALLLQDSPAGRQMMDYFLSYDFQNLLPLGNWVLPVNQDVALPEVFEKYVPKITANDKVFDPSSFSFEETQAIFQKFDAIWSNP